MKPIEHKPCAVWMDRFNKPTLDQIRDSLTAADSALVDAFHEAMQRMKGVSHQFVWHGEGWYWSIEYQHTSDDLPLAVLVPAPEDVKVAMPIDPEFTRKISVTRLKRSIRDGLELSLDPFDAKWAMWSLQTGSFIDDLMSLIQRKAKFLAGRAGTAA